MPDVALVFSCDRHYFPLAKGLVLSLQRFGLPDSSTSLNLVDIGCDEQDLAWFAANGVNVVRFRIEDHYRFDPDSIIHSHYGSLLCRPMIPDLFPGHDIYVHIDSDIWIQKIECLRDYIDICRAHPDKVVITPCVDYSYVSDYIKTLDNLNAVYRVYNVMYGREVADRLATRPILSCGMFAMRAEHPIWAEWKPHLDANFNRNYPYESDKPAAEQLSLNYLLYQREGSFIPLSATHNYQCHAGYPLRTAPKGEVVVGFPPREPIGVIHLTCAGRNIHTYYRFALFFDQGRYFDERDLRTLKLIAS